MTDRPLFALALGERFGGLPAAVRAVHAPGHRLELAGRAEVLRGRHLGATVIAALFRLPVAGTDVEVEVVIEPTGAGEVWTRTFAGRRFRSVLTLHPAGQGRVVERFGPLSFELAVLTDADGLAMVVTGLRLGPLRLPAWLRPAASAREFVDDEGRFRFDVALTLPWVGLFVHYRGWLKPRPAWGV